MTISVPFMSSCPTPQNTSHRKVKLPALSGVSRSVVTLPGTMSARTAKSGRLKPIGTSGAVNCKTTVSPRFTRSSRGTKSNFLATTSMTRSSAFAITSAASEPSASAPVAPNNVRRFVSMFMASRLLYGQLGDHAGRRWLRRLNLAHAEPFVGLRRVPGQRRAPGLRAGCRQREDQRLGRVVGDVPGHVVVLLMDVAVEHRHVGVRHQQLDGTG